MILAHRKWEKPPPTTHGPTAEDAAAMRQDVAHSRKQKFFYGRLVMQGRPSMKRMESRLLAFLNKQTDPRKRNPYITR